MMYPTRLNLLSPEKRAYIRHVIYVQFLKTSLESLVFTLSISGIILLGSEWTLQNYFNDLSFSLVTTNAEHAEKNSQIKQVNHLLLRTASIQDNYVLWTPKILALAKAIPDRVTLLTLSLDRTGNAYHLTGTAATRDDLLLLQKNLEGLDSVTQVLIPLSQLTEKANVSFSITAELTP